MLIFTEGQTQLVPTFICDICKAPVEEASRAIVIIRRNKAASICHISCDVIENRKEDEGWTTLNHLMFCLINNLRVDLEAGEIHHQIDSRI